MYGFCTLDGSFGVLGALGKHHWSQGMFLQALSSLCTVWGWWGGLLALLISPLPFQMTIYLTFPVAMFWIANQAGWFEDYVIQRKVGTGSFRGWGRLWGTNLMGTSVCLP